MIVSVCVAANQTERMCGMQYLVETSNGVREPLRGGQWAYESAIRLEGYYHVILTDRVAIIRKGK